MGRQSIKARQSSFDWKTIEFPVIFPPRGSFRWFIPPRIFDYQKHKSEPLSLVPSPDGKTSRYLSPPRLRAPGGRNMNMERDVCMETWKGVGRICTYGCAACGFHMPTGWGFQTYVTDDRGNRVRLAHPIEMPTIRKVLGPRFDMDTFKERFGRLWHAACTSCLHVFSLDIDADARLCPECGSGKVRTALELVGQPCPACKDGTFEETWTGAIS